MRQLHADAVEGVEGVALAVAARAGQRGAELRLKHSLHEGAVAAQVVSQGLSRHHLVGAPYRILETEYKLLIGFPFKNLHFYVSSAQCECWHHGCLVH